MAEPGTLYSELENLIRPYYVGSVGGTWIGGGLRVADPVGWQLDGHIRADTLPGGLPPADGDGRDLRRRLLERSEDLMEALAAAGWLACHSTLRQEFSTSFGSPLCTLGNEVVQPAPQFQVSLKLSVELRKFGKAA
jgi:hypothetical protein